MLKNNHYDVAFADYLRRLRVPFISVDEARRAQALDLSLKSMDFIVSRPGQTNLLVDVKGRKFPSGRAMAGSCWENWVTDDDVDSLLKWQEVFGSGFRALVVFAYDVHPRYRGRFPELHEFRDTEYAFLGVWVDEYAVEMRERSAAWKTRALPRRVFRELSQPIRAILGLSDGDEVGRIDGQTPMNIQNDLPSDPMVACPASEPRT